MKAVKNELLEGSVSQLTPRELSDLYFIIDGIRYINETLTPAAAKFVFKNLKKLKAAINKANNAEKAVLDSFAEKDEKGRLLFWDGFKERLNAEKQPIPDNEEAIYGKRAYLVADKNQLIDTFTGQPIEQHKISLFQPYIKTTEKQDECTAKIKELKDLTYEVHLTRIDFNYLEDTAQVKIPSSTNKNPANINCFFEHLVIGGQTDTDEE